MDVFQFVIGEPPITDPRTLSPVHDRLRVRHHRLLEALERSENLGQAAEELGITQSAATKILQDAEELLGLPLFERRHRGMAPTEIGRFVIGYARRILNDIGAANDNDVERATVVAEERRLLERIPEPA